MIFYYSYKRKRRCFPMKPLGKIIINVLKDKANHYSFDVQEENDDLTCIKYVIEDTLKMY